ncbi:hypothetical protein DKT68_13395 [Micromonospora acroterricola]|uniref:Uncharacterized protein n=1 Tax=Micromonospora acroterricola TaxID=2202421 RepID=A0A317D270_9ACTN|nr:hypothetical protein DKT68_13395 [Micromonospora acroterricola]
MTQPSSDPHERPSRPRPPSAPGRQLDRPNEDSRSWTVDNVDGGTTTGVSSVVTPDQPPELNPQAAAALLKLLTHLNDRHTEHSKQENG